jgi:hypothetical protein
MTDTATPPILPISTPDPSPEQVGAALAKLREPFPEHQVSKLPKQVKKGDTDRYSCVKGTPNFSKASKDGVECGGYHAWSVHLDYVGHAALTDRLLSTDLLWDWEPLAVDDTGLPQFDRNGGMWIRLTVAGVTRLGYGDSQGKTGPNAVKEAIGDALRNAAMRFGAALDLWHKGDLHDAAAEQGRDGLEAGANETPGRDWEAEAARCKTTAEYISLFNEAKKLKVDRETIAKMREHGTKLKEAEDAEAQRQLDEADAAAAARAHAESEAASQVAQSFASGSQEATNA